MPKSPADADHNPPLPPCDFSAAIAFILGENLTIGFNGGAAHKPCPPPPGGSLPPLTYAGGNTWSVDVFQGVQHWGAGLLLHCPGPNPRGTLTVLYADTTGTYTGDYELFPTNLGAGDYQVQDPLEAPAIMPVAQL